MRRMARFLVVFLAGVALLAYLASSAVQRTTRRWFEADIAQRMAGLAQKNQPALLARWTAGARQPFEAMLTDLARDRARHSGRGLRPEQPTAGPHPRLSL